eukprot:GAHX01000947.1.p1 GENE.GAHX01000947.1~~GAHX01000947.1.p1  ORF type:complete len:531 (-),score=97.15 GAHX01000947.1:61-1653(-)
MVLKFYAKPDNKNDILKLFHFASPKSETKEILYLSCLVQKSQSTTSSGQIRALMVTSESVYNLGSPNNEGRIDAELFAHLTPPRVIPLKEITAITKLSDLKYFILHVGNEYDYMISAHSNARKLISCIIYTASKYHQKDIPYYVRDPVVFKYIYRPKKEIASLKSLGSLAEQNLLASKIFLHAQKDPAKNYSIYSVIKINKRLEKQHRVLLITDSYIINANSKAKVKRIIDIKEVYAISFSCYCNRFVLHISNNYDYYFETPQAFEIINLCYFNSLKLQEINNKSNENFYIHSIVKSHKFQYNNPSLESKLGLIPLLLSNMDIIATKKSKVAKVASVMGHTSNIKILLEKLKNFINEKFDFSDILITSKGKSSSTSVHVGDENVVQQLRKSSLPPSLLTGKSLLVRRKPTISSTSFEGSLSGNGVPPIMLEELDAEENIELPPELVIDEDGETVFEEIIQKNIDCRNLTMEMVEQDTKTAEAICGNVINGRWKELYINSKEFVFLFGINKEEYVKLPGKIREILKRKAGF